MRVAVLVSEFPALSETFVLSQITGLIDRGHSVTIIADHPRVENAVHPEVERYRLLERTRYFALPRLNGGKIVRSVQFARTLYSRYRREPAAIFDFLNIVQRGRDKAPARLLARAAFDGEHDFDVLLAHFGPNGNRALLLRESGALTGKIATVFHGYDISQMLNSEPRGFYDELLRDGDLFLPVSRHFSKRLLQVGARYDRLMVHHMGINPLEYPFRERRLIGKVRFVSVGRLVEKKGFDIALHALAAAAKSMDEFHYTIIGEGPQRQNLEALIAKLSLEKHVTLRGACLREQILAELLSSHIFLAPSLTANDGDMEGIPLVLMEAMATGLPVVSTLHGGIPELIEDEISGYLAPENNSAALLRTIWRALDWRAAWPQIGIAARRAVEREFNINALNDQLVEQLEILTHASYAHAA